MTQIKGEARSLVKILQTDRLHMASMYINVIKAKRNSNIYAHFFVVSSHKNLKN